MKKEKEIRQISSPARIEMREDGAPGSIYGYPIVYNKDSEDMGFIERIAPGAATKALKRSDIRALKNHDPSLIFGRQDVNLKFTEDKDGLRYDATPVNTHNYREISEEIRLGLLTGQSFGFTVLADEWSDLDTDHPRRTITEIGELFDVGPVTYPAYSDTTVALRSMDAAKADPVAHTIDAVVIECDDIEYLFKDVEHLQRFLTVVHDMKDAAGDPMIPETRTTGPDPMIVSDPDNGDSILDKIKEIVERLQK